MSQMLLLCRLQRDLARAASEGWKLGLKTVRGAYMHVERSLALDKGVPSPIHSSLADTHGCYDRSVLPGNPMLVEVCDQPLQWAMPG